MPDFTSRSFAKHNRKLGGRKLGKAARIANAMMKRGVPEGESIATANARAEGKPRRGAANSPLANSERNSPLRASSMPRTPLPDRLKGR